MEVKPFRFKENRVPLDLNGHVVYVPLKTLSDAIAESVKKQIPSLKRILDGGENAENVEKCAEILADWHRSALGEEAFGAVYLSRDTSFADYCDSYCYICDAVKAFCSERAKGLTVNESSDR